MANVMLGFPNRIDAATLSGGSWQATLPLSNLQTRTLGKVARSSNALAASTKFDIDLGAEKNIRVLSLVNHNLSLAATCKIVAAATADFASPIYDSGNIEVWPVVYPADALDWEEDNWWDGKYTAEQREGYTWTAVHILQSNILARYWRVEITDSGNAAGYVQIGRVFIGPAWQPETNMSWGLALGWQTDTELQQARSGALYFSRRTPRRVTRFSLENMTEDEALANAFELQRRAGIDAEVLYIFDPDDTVHALRRRFLARMRELSPIENPYPNGHQTPVQIEELL